MKKVYRDKTLPYNQEEKFNLPEDFNACQKEDDMTEYGIDEVYE